MRLAYADPPYLGCCGLYGHRHEDPWGCWDDPMTHVRLFDYLGDFDGYAYSLTSQSLGTLLPLAKEVGLAPRTAAWTKTFAAFKANVRVAYAWEPVLFEPGRDSSKDGAQVGRDFLRCPITLRKGLTGAKPEKFCRWVLDVLLGYLDGDEIVDVFPGTGVMGRVAAQGTFAFVPDEEGARDG